MSPDSIGAAGEATAGYGPPKLAVPYFPTPRGIMGVQQTYGTFKYTELGKGNVDIDDVWELDNIVRVRNVCGTMFSIQLHRLVIPLFEDAFRAAMTAAPGYVIKKLGGYCPRHKMHDPKRGLSIHSWGAAFDVNWDENPVSDHLITDLPSAFVKAFTDRGWDWGGNWHSSKDSMHFQFAVGV